MGYRRFDIWIMFSLFKVISYFLQWQITIKPPFGEYVYIVFSNHLKQIQLQQLFLVAHFEPQAKESKQKLRIQWEKVRKVCP